MIDYLHIVVCVCVILAALGVAIERLVAAWFQRAIVRERMIEAAYHRIAQDVRARTAFVAGVGRPDVIEGKAKRIKANIDRSDQ